MHALYTVNLHFSNWKNHTSYSIFLQGTVPFFFVSLLIFFPRNTFADTHRGEGCIFPCKSFMRLCNFYDCILLEPAQQWRVSKQVCWTSDFQCIFSSFLFIYLNNILENGKDWEKSFNHPFVFKFLLERSSQLFCLNLTRQIFSPKRRFSTIKRNLGHYVYE